MKKRKYAELRSSDFPGVSSSDFSLWQRAIVSANRNMWLFGFVWGMIGAIVLIPDLSQSIFGVGLVLGVFPTIATVFLFIALGRVARYFIYRKSADLAQHLSISEDAIKRARLVNV